MQTYLRNIIIKLQNCDTWNIPSKTAINFISSKYDKIENIFQSLYSKYQENLETSMKRSDFTFDSVQLMYYKCDNVNFQRGSSYIDSSN